MAAQPRAGRAQPAETRARILDAAARLFAEQGYASTSLREISDELGFTKAALYYHFQSKEDILSELIAPPLRRIVAVLETPHDVNQPAGRRALVAAILRAIADSETDAVAIFRDPQVRPIMARDPSFVQVSRQATGLLAAGLSGTADPADALPAHRVRAAAAVAAAHEAMRSWEMLVAPKSTWTDAEFDQIAGFASAILEDPAGP